MSVWGEQRARMAPLSPTLASSSALASFPYLGGAFPGYIPAPFPNFAPATETESHWLVTSKGIFSSTIRSQKDACPCFGWGYVAQQGGQDSFLKSLKRFGIVHSDPVAFTVLLGAHSAILHEKFHKKTVIQEMAFTRFCPAKGKGTPGGSTKFSNCVLCGISLQGEVETYAFYFNKISSQILVIDPETGSPAGNAVFSKDFTQAEGK